MLLMLNVILSCEEFAISTVLKLNHINATHAPAMQIENISESLIILYDNNCSIYIFGPYLGWIFLFFCVCRLGIHSLTLASAPKFMAAMNVIPVYTKCNLFILFIVCVYFSNIVLNILQIEWNKLNAQHHHTHTHTRTVMSSWDLLHFMRSFPILYACVAYSLIQHTVNTYLCGVWVRRMCHHKRRTKSSWRDHFSLSRRNTAHCGHRMHIHRHTHIQIYMPCVRKVI